MATKHATKTFFYTIGQGNLGTGKSRTHHIKGSTRKVATFTVEPAEPDDDDLLLNPDGTKESIEVERVFHRIDRLTGKRKISVTVRNTGTVECAYVLHAAFIEPVS